MLRANTTLQHGRYRIIRRIGQGGMGAVYEAYDNNLSNRVALKEALVSDADLLRAFEREAQRLDRLRHAALPTVKDHFIEGGGQYLVMEFIDGQDLRQMLKQRGQPFPVRNVLEWADRLLDALTYLHSRKRPLIHRDIKPANLKLTRDGEIILLDFGLAKGGLTQSGGRSVDGYTLAYAPPEQILGQPTDERSDLYALGATLYELLTGQKPHNATLRQKYINDGYPDPLKPVNQVNPQVPPHVAQAIQRAMALDPNQRPHSAAQMRAMLNPQPAKAPPPSSSRGGNRQAWLIFGATVAALLLFCGLLGIYMVEAPISSATEVIVVPATATEMIGETATQAPPTETAAPTATAEPTATPTLGIDSTAVAEKDGMVQLYVPAGEFEMGSAEDDPDAADDEKPRHTVYLDAFWIDKTEVTNGMFARFVQQTGHQTDAEEGGGGWVWDGSEWKKVEGGDWQHPRGPESDLDGLDDHPVIQVSWNDATAYCEWAERRLPTEAEWEKAAGGGIPTEEGPRKYAWGNEPPTGERLNFCDQNCPLGHKTLNVYDGYEFTAPVGNYPAGASPYGALDMAGNVWEWVEDNYDPNYYASSPRENPPGPSVSGRKVLRGESWVSSAAFSRLHSRRRDGPDGRAEDIGFRCARSP